MFFQIIFHLGQSQFGEELLLYLFFPIIEPNKKNKLMYVPDLCYLNLSYQLSSEIAERFLVIYTMIFVFGGACLGYLGFAFEREQGVSELVLLTRPRHALFNQVSFEKQREDTRSVH